MKQKTAGERKRSVAVVVGPKTVQTLTEMGQKWQAQMGSPMGDWATVVGVALDHEIQVRQRLLGMVVNSFDESHYD